MVTSGIFKKIKKKELLKSNKLFIFALLIWPTLHFLVFWIYIYSNTVFLSLHGIDHSGFVYIGLKNFSNFFKEMSNANSSLYFGILNSISIFFFNVFVLIPASVFVSYCFFKKIAGYKVFRVIFFLPSITSIVILTMMFRWAFDGNIGFMNSIIRTIGFQTPELGFLGEDNSFRMVLVYSLWVGIGFFAMLITGSMSRIPPELIESAHIDGAGFFTEFFKIIVPLISTIIATLTIMSMSSVFTYFLPPLLLTAGGPNGRSYTIALSITLSAKSDAASSATIGVICTCIGVPLVLGVKYLVNKLFPEVEF